MPTNSSELRIKALEGKMRWLEQERQAREQIIGIDGYLQALDELEAVPDGDSKAEAKNPDQGKDA